MNASAAIVTHGAGIIEMFFMGFEYKIPVFDAHILCAVEVILQPVIAPAMAVLFDCPFGEV